MQEEKEFLGIIKWFDPEKGFGIIDSKSQGEVFIHGNSTRGITSFLGGEPVVFQVKIDPKKSRTNASLCRFPHLKEDIKLIWTLIGLDDSFIFDKRENLFSDKKSKYKGHLRVISGKLILKTIGYDSFTNYVKETFTEAKNKIEFQGYCSIIETLYHAIDKEKGEEHLRDLYAFFHENMDSKMGFSTWKHEKYHRLNLSGPEDLSISIEFFLENLDLLELDDLKKTVSFDFHQKLKEVFVNKKMEFLNHSEFEKIPPLFNLINELLPEKEEETEKQFQEIYLIHFKKSLDEILSQAKSPNYAIGDIKSLFQFKFWKTSKKTKEFLTAHAFQTIKKGNNIALIISSWLSGYLDQPEIKLIETYLLNNPDDQAKKILIFDKLETDQQFKFLEIFFLQGGVEKTYEFLKEYLRSKNIFFYDSAFQDVLFNHEFWERSGSSKLKELEILVNGINKFVDNALSPDEKNALFFKDLYPTITVEFIESNKANFSLNDWNKIFESFQEFPEKIEKWFFEILEYENLSISNLISKVKSLISKEHFSSIDLELKKRLDKEKYFELWKDGDTQIAPIDEIISSLNESWESFQFYIEKSKSYSQIKDGVGIALIQILTQNKEFSTRGEFLYLQNCFKALLEIDDSRKSDIISLEYPFYNLLAWFYTDSDTFDFEILKKKYIFFDPEEQVLLFKKLFAEISKGQLDFSIDDLRDLRRFDVDLFKTNFLHHKDVPIDISTDLVIKILESLNQNGKIISETDILTLVLNDLTFNKSKRFKFGKYFEKCEGRMIGEYNWKSNGGIRKEDFGENKFYFAITFPSHIGTERGREIWNPNFKHLVESVKNIPGRKWNADEGHWGVPAKYEEHVINFAKEERFFLDFEGSNYKNNPHLAEFKRDVIPSGISFCEGRLSNNLDNYLNKEFWWCAGNKCFQKCEFTHGLKEWKKFTLIDFCTILGISLDETNRMGDFIPNGLLSKFAGLINRFNRLLEKLYCKECDEILHAVDTSHFAAHNVVRFHCVNKNCSCKEEVYLNHCLNGQCNCIIDSRESKKCLNGLYICPNCGSCCSHSQMNRRLSNLKETGGFIHENLKRSVLEKLGHSERAEYFCYKCGDAAKEIGDEVFKCSACNVTYETKKFNLPRIHKNLRKNQTDGPWNIPPEEDGDDISFF